MLLLCWQRAKPACVISCLDWRAGGSYQSSVDPACGSLTPLVFAGRSEQEKARKQRNERNGSAGKDWWQRSTEDGETLKQVAGLRVGDDVPAPAFPRILVTAGAPGPLRKSRACKISGKRAVSQSTSAPACMTFTLGRYGFITAHTKLHASKRPRAPSGRRRSLQPAIDLRSETGLPPGQSNHAGPPNTRLHTPTAKWALMCGFAALLHSFKRFHDIPKEVFPSPSVALMTIVHWTAGEGRSSLRGLSLLPHRAGDPHVCEIHRHT